MKKLLLASLLLAGTSSFSFAAPNDQPAEDAPEVVKVEAKEVKNFREGLASTKQLAASIADEQGKRLIWFATGDASFKPVPTGDWKELLLAATANFNEKMGKTYGYDEVKPFICESAIVVAPAHRLTEIIGDEVCSVLYYEKEMKYYISGKEFNPKTLKLVEDEEKEKAEAEAAKTEQAQ